MLFAHFELIDEDSSKFWEIWIEGTQVFTRHGRIGAQGRVSVRFELDELRAHQLFKKLVHAKVTKGYVEKNG